MTKKKFSDVSLKCKKNKASIIDSSHQISTKIAKSISSSSAFSSTVFYLFWDNIAKPKLHRLDARERIAERGNSEDTNFHHATARIDFVTQIMSNNFVLL